jgi:DNA-binding MarR family transcriptional regulator
VWPGSEGPVTRKQLADHADPDPMMTSQVMRTPIRRGPVDRSPHPDEGRARSSTVTAAGRRLVDRAIVDVEACGAALSARLATFFAPVKGRQPGCTRPPAALRAVGS